MVTALRLTQHPKIHLSERSFARFPAARAVSQPMPCLVPVPYLRLPRSLEESVLQADWKGAEAVLIPSARTQELELFVFPGHRQDTYSHLLKGF